MSVFNANPSGNGSKKGPGPAQAIHTLLGKGTLWKGEIHAGPNSLRVEGSIEGTVHSEGEVTIAPSGVVNGTIHAKHLIVTGRVEGVFKIEECLEIHGTGWVEGEVEVGSLVVDEGGTLQGTCTRRGAAKESAAPGSKTKHEELRPHDRTGTSPINGLPAGSELPYAKAFDKKP
jgi:cytoskeletal protein CcmA (bactofilin family)